MNAQDLYFCAEGQRERSDQTSAIHKIYANVSFIINNRGEGPWWLIVSMLGGRRRCTDIIPVVVAAITIRVSVGSTETIPIVDVGVGVI